MEVRPVGCPPVVVTISAAYGAGGGFVGPEVAERLGVAFVDRAVTAAVAAEIAERVEEVAGFEEHLGEGISHWLSCFTNASGPWGITTGPPEWFHDETGYKRHVASVLHREAGRGAVVLGRGAQVVLADVPWALHVRLDGPVERRIGQAVELGGLDETAARRAQHRTDAARHRYFHRLYGGNVADPRYYHLVIDSTAVPWASCVDIVVAAVHGRDELRRLDDVADGGPAATET